MSELHNLNLKIVDLEKLRTGLKKDMYDIETEISNTKIELENIKANAEESIYNNPEYKNEKARKSATKLLLESDMAYQGKLDLISSKEKVLQDIKLQLRENLTELNYHRRRYEILRIEALHALK